LKEKLCPSTVCLPLHHRRHVAIAHIGLRHVEKFRELIRGCDYGPEKGPCRKGRWRSTRHDYFLLKRGARIRSKGIPPAECISLDGIRRVPLHYQAHIRSVGFQPAGQSSWVVPYPHRRNDYEGAPPKGNQKFHIDVSSVCTPSVYFLQASRNTRQPSTKAMHKWWLHIHAVSRLTKYMVNAKDTPKSHVLQGCVSILDVQICAEVTAVKQFWKLEHVLNVVPALIATDVPAAGS
jgi:hypothetical protein